jgi:hypothetical protein
MGCRDGEGTAADAIALVAEYLGSGLGEATP